MIEVDKKEFARIYLIFIAMLSALVFLAVLFIKISDKAWTRGLRNTVYTVLDDRMEGEWNVLENIKIENPFSLSAQAYEVQNRYSGERKTAIVIRVTTLFGPLPAVYLYKKGEVAEFIGFAAVHGRVRTSLESGASFIFINYWAHRIPDILNK